MSAPAPRLLWLLAISAGMTVASLYYAQPLLAEMARAFDAPPREIGLVTTVTQLGYATGMLLFVPLADAYDRRLLILGAVGLEAVGLVVVGIAPSLPLLLAASYVMGAVTVTPQLSVPYAATLADDATRGRSVGLVMSGLLIGILLSRTVSGALARPFGWRAPFLIAAGACVALGLVLARLLPSQRPARRVAYRELLGSLPRLVATLPPLRRHAVLGGLTFGAFSVFWTTLPFRLATPPLDYGSDTAGLFGLVGVAGALAAPLAGRLADRFGSRVVNAGAIAVVIVSYAMLAAFGDSLVGLAAGVILLDFGAQANHISNQTRVLGLAPELRNRLNTVYMVSYFLGGSLGSALGAFTWNRWAWAGVTACGAGFGVAALVAFFVLPGAVQTRPLVASQSR